MTTEPSLLEAGQNCWRVARADRFAMIVDAADYFVALRNAMLKAKHTIYLIGWDFDARVSLDRDPGEGPEKLGDFIVWLADRNPSLTIRLLRWDTGAIKAMFRGNTLATMIRWKWHKQITLKLDSAHPMASSHHQKIVVIDDCIAFCGGIDITIGRWDRRLHLDDDPMRVGPDGRPYKPWHDVTSAFDGEAAKAMGALARRRWQVATGEELGPTEMSHDCWPDDLQPSFKGIDLGLARTQPAMTGVEPIHEIETLYLDLIARAKRWIYAESQYFASRRVAHAIARRLAEPDGPEVVVVNPITAEGWLEPIAMDSARARLVRALRDIDRHDRFRLYHPVTAGGDEIYVHAKVTAVDEAYLRVGSSNFNNRSMRLDTECDVVVSASHVDAPGSDEAAGQIAALRNDLIAEHLDTTPAVVAAGLEQTGSLVATIDALRGETTGRTLRPYELPDLNDTFKWLADNEIMDPDGPEALFEPLSKRSLFKGWRTNLRRKARRALGRSDR